MSLSDPLADLPRLKAEALQPCCICGTSTLQGLPLFYRFTVRNCGIDGNEVRKHAGLAAMLGGGAGAFAIADAMGAHRDPVVVMGQAEVNVCQSCAMDGGNLTRLIGEAHAAMANEGEG